MPCSISEVLQAAVKATCLIGSSLLDEHLHDDQASFTSYLHSMSAGKSLLLLGTGCWCCVACAGRQLRQRTLPKPGRRIQSVDQQGGHASAQRDGMTSAPRGAVDAASKVSLNGQTSGRQKHLNRNL